MHITPREQQRRLQYPQSAEGQTVRIDTNTIVDVCLGEWDKPVGGLPMALGKTAAPFGGGRVVSLFGHKKYDFLTVEYRDSNGGLHGAIFQLNKGQGEILRKNLAADGAHIAGLPQSTLEAGNEKR